MKADLHVHSVWSDGSLPVPELARLAKALGLGALAITDHDTMAGQGEALEEGRRRGIRIIPGVEVSALDGDTGRKVHILGYMIQDAEGLTRACLPYLEDRGRANREAGKLIRAAGYPVEDEEFAAYAGKGGILYRQHLMHALADRGYTATIYGPLYAEIFGPGGLAVVAGRYMAVEEAVRLIKDCGGYPVLAHPFMYDSLGLIPALVKRGLAGIEWRHHTQTPERERLVLETAERHGLFLTGGSDFHGLYSEKPLRPGAFVMDLRRAHPLA
jgi:predicted metal-dependent phosphoesterase TrpH